MAERPKVWMVSASFHPSVGGAEKQALELSVALRERGLEARVLTRRVRGLPARDVVRGVPVERLRCLGGGMLNALTFLLSLSWNLLRRRGEYDVVHAHLSGSPALAAAAAGRLLGKRAIVKIGGGPGIGELATSARSRAGRLKLRALSRLRPQFVAVARDLAQEAKAYLGDVPIHLVPNGVDTRRYHPRSPVEKEALRARWGWPSGLGFLYTGRFSSEKRLPWFLRRWASAGGPASSFFAVVGEGPERAALEGLKRELRLEGRLFILPPQEAVEHAYAAADLFVLPSVSEGLSNALLEAMASGLGVLASKVGGTAEALEGTGAGVLFADEAELDAALRRLLAEPATARPLGEEGRRLAERRYAMDRIAARYEELYSEAYPQSSTRVDS